MDIVEKLFVAWVVLALLMFAVAIYSLVLSLRNRRDINRLENNN